MMGTPRNGKVKGATWVLLRWVEKRRHQFCAKWKTVRQGKEQRASLTRCDREKNWGEK
jgi:hypothetical protein